MAYKKISAATRDTMVESVKAFAKDYEKAAGDKKQADKAKELKAQLKLKSENFGKYMLKLANEAKAMYDTHTLRVEGWLKDVAEKHKAIKAAAAKFSKKPDFDVLQEMVKLSKETETIANGAREDAADLADAWMNVRQGNYNAKGFEPKDLKPFLDLRNTIIGGLKSASVKIEKMHQMAEEAKVFVNDMRVEIGKGGGTPDIGMLKEDCDDLIKELDTYVRNAQGSVTGKQSAAMPALRNIANQKIVEPGQIVGIQMKPAEFLKEINEYKGQLKLMGLKCNQLEKIAKGHDGEVDRKLTEAREKIPLMEKAIKDVLDMYKESTTLIEQARKRVKKK